MCENSMHPHFHKDENENALPRWSAVVSLSCENHVPQAQKNSGVFSSVTMHFPSNPRFLFFL